MKLIIIGINDNVDETTLRVALQKFAKIVNGTSTPIVIEEADLKIAEQERTDFEKIIDDVITICGSPQKRIEFDAAFWTKFIGHFKDRDDAKVILNKIVDSCYNDTEARAYLRKINADRIFELCKLALGMIR